MKKNTGNKRIFRSFILSIKKRSSLFRMYAYIGGAILVFLVTYMMILPAITIDKESAANQPGMRVSGSVESGQSLGIQEGQTTETAQKSNGSAISGKTESDIPGLSDRKDNQDKGNQKGSDQKEDSGSGKDSGQSQSGSDHGNSSDTVDTETDSSQNVNDNSDTDKTGHGNQNHDGSDGSNGNGSDGNGSDGSQVTNDSQEDPNADSYTMITGPVNLVYEGEDYTVSASIDETSMLPEGVSLQVKEIRKNVKKEKKQYQGYYDKALEEINRIDGNEDMVDQEAFSFARFFDICFVKDGQEYEPASPVDISIKLDQSKNRKAVEGADAVSLKDKDRIRVVHFDESGRETQVEEVFNDSVKNKKKKNIDIQFAGESFSVYGVVYTVDFHWEADGKKYEFSMPGGGYISLTDLIKKLKVPTADTITDDNTVKEFIANIDQVQFSDPSLVWAGKADQSTTVGELKKAKDLDVQYSSQLTKDQIKEINAQTVKAGDWALISVQAFDSEETLTVTMNNGDEWAVKVTDAQISSNYINANGEHYEVTVTYGEDACIPDGSTLKIHEFVKGSKEYKEAYEIVSHAEESKQKKEGTLSKNNKEVTQEDSDKNKKDSQSVMFIDELKQSPIEMDVLDISIYDKKHEIVEPKAAVKVSIIRKDFPEDTSISTLETSLTVNHLNDHTGEMNVETVAEPNGEAADNIEVREDSIKVEFLTDSFSTYTVSWGGAVAGTGISVVTPGQYIIYAKDAANGNYYALVPRRNSNGSLSTVQLTNNNGVISYSGNIDDLYWTYSKNGDYYRFSFRSGYSTYYLAAGTFGGQVTTSTSGTNGYGNAYTTLFGQYNDHLHAAGDTFLRCNNGVFQFIHDVSSGWEGRSQVFFARPADTKTVTVHYGYMDGNNFVEFDELPEGAATVYGAPKMVGDQLNVRYDIEGKDYITTRLNDPVSGTQISPLLQTESNSAAYWKYRILNTVSVNDGINQWQPFDQDDNDLYVIYRDTPTELSYDTGDIDPGDLEAPAATKTFESNHDGTYDLVLGVTGKSNQAQQKTHANIVIVLDTSSSMYNTYSENPRVELGYTRLSAAKSAICDLADQLFGMNSADDPATIEVAFVNFSHRVRNEQTMQTIYSGTDPSAFKDMINDTNGSGGTNYDTAIEAANSILWNDADPTYVVFVTDGDTVSRGYLKYNEDSDGSDHAGDWDGGTYYNGDTDTYGDTYLQRAREAAKIQTDKVQNSGKKFYSIGVFGNVAYLEQMGGTYLGQANDKEAIEDAFSKIISEIKLDLGYKDVVVNDGLTALTSTTLEHGSAGNFVYYRGGGSKADGTEKYNSAANNGRGEIWNIEEGSEKEAFFLEIKDANTFYKNGSKWTDISAEQKAAYIEKYGVGSRTVVWDLGTEMLEDGVTYKVAFTIWPSQEAYDLVADLNNGTVKYEELDDSVKAQIVENNGIYYVKTNTVATVDYTSVRMEDGKVTETKTGSSTIKDPEGKMNLDTSIMTVRKEFAHLINEADPYEEIVFYLLVDGKYYNKDGSLSDTLDEFKVYAINLPKDGQWEDTIYIAPGLMRGGEILETGHNYSLEEKIVSGNPYEYEFAPQTVRPMVITAVPTFLVKKDTFNTNQENKKEYTFNDAKNSYIEVNGKSDAAGTYYAASENDGSLVGVNHKTSELDITKMINDPQDLLTEAQEKAETFTYRVTLQIPDGCDPSGIVGYEYVPRTQANAFTLFGYQTGQSAFPEDIARFNGKTYRAWNTLVYDALIEYERVTENGNTYIKAKRDADGKIIWKVPAVDGYHTITYDMTLKQDEVIRFTNLPTGTKYTIQEIYANKYPADNAGGKTDGRTPVEDQSNLSAEGYAIEKVQHTGGTLSADQSTVTGTIEAPDTRYYNQFTNKKVTESQSTRVELKIKKVVKDYTWGQEYYRFTLTADTATYTDTEGGSGTSPMPDGTQNSAVSIYNTTPDHTLSFGTIRYTRLGTYTYTVSEYDNSNNMPDVRFASPVTLTVAVTAGEDGKLSVEKVEDDRGTTVYTAETATALATGLTTQTNTAKAIRISKVDKNNSDKVLADAVFEILNGNVKMYIQDGKLLDAQAVEEIIGVPVSAEGADQAMEEKEILSSFTLGEIDIRDFTVNTVYELREMTPPAGYVILDGSVYFKVVSEDGKTYMRLTDQNGTILTGENGSPVLDNDSAVISENALTISVKNEPGAALPNTGGTGTNIIYLFGIMLMALAGAGLMMKRA